jgi:ribosomal protein L10
LVVSVVSWMRNSWTDHKGELSIVEGTLIHLAVEHLPGRG